MVSIPEYEYDQLMSDSKWLCCLEEAGVDNWGGIDEAREIFEKS